MLYIFKSKASGEVIMLGTHAQALLRLLGKDPNAPGILPVAAMPAALSSLEAACQSSPPPLPPAPDENAPHDTLGGLNAPDADAAEAISLRQRLWPFIDLVKRSQAAGVPVVWGA